MRIAIVGPAHPYKGGITLHTTELAHRLTQAGHEVTVVSWRSQWPFFFPGQQFVPGGKPELPLHDATMRVLSWKNPPGWARWGRKLRSYDRLVFVWWVPTIQAPIYLGMLQALGKKRPRVTVICHNVLPHETKPGVKQFASAVLKRCDNIIVHTPAQARLAAKLTKRPIDIVTLPLPLHKLQRQASQNATVRKELLFFGFIRPYKGVDILLQALARIPGVKLTIAGEFWGDSQTYRKLITQLGLQTTVTIIDGYIPADDLAHYIKESDAVVLPYKEGTASWNVSLAHAYGTPVIATTAGSLSQQVHEGIDGILCKPNDVSALEKAIKDFYKPGVASKLRAGVPTISADEDWQDYVDAVTKD